MRQVPRLSALLVALAALAAPAGAADPVPAPPPRIAQPEYAARRAALAARLPDGVILALGARAPREDYFPFYQGSDFAWLTGWDEPDAALVLVRRDGRVVRSTLFVSPRDPAAEVWTGARLGPDGARALTGLPARPASALRLVLDSLLAQLPASARFSVVGDLGGGDDGDAPPSLSPDAQFVQALLAAHPGVEMRPAAGMLQQLRGTKSAAELALIRQSAAITAEAQRDAMRAAAPGRNEYELAARIEYAFKRNGAMRPSFATIVGSGPNATTLHYERDDRVMRAGDVVVMDIGAAFRGYASDVTRTIPVSGTFTPAQRDVYAIVRAAQAAAERQAVPGAAAHLMEDSATAVLARGLARLGLIDSVNATYDCGEEARCPQYRLYYMHGVGHGIGLEVHDPDQYYFTGTLATGSAFTIEPGIYVRANLLTEVLLRTRTNDAFAARIANAVAKYANVGVRIEDDYVIGEHGLEWISRAPREIEEVEAAMAERVLSNAER